MELQPMHDRIVIRKVDIEVRSAGGLILSGQEVDTSKDVGVGRVLFVGEGKITDKGERIPMTVKVGDYITFNDRIPLRWHYQGQYTYTLRESDVLHIIKDKNIFEVEHSETHGKDFEMKSVPMN